MNFPGYDREHLTLDEEKRQGFGTERLGHPNPRAPHSSPTILPGSFGGVRDGGLGESGCGGKRGGVGSGNLNEGGTEKVGLMGIVKSKLKTLNKLSGGGEKSGSCMTLISEKSEKSCGEVGSSVVVGIGGMRGGESNSSAKGILLECPYCNMPIYNQSPMQERAVNKTTDKRRLNRFCGFLAVFLSIFLILSSLLEQADIKNEGAEAGAQYWTPNLKIKRLPQCIIIGARKCGTRALIDMLNLHPQVEKAALEVHFFDRDDNYAKGLEWYRQHMPECREDQIGIEKSPSYFITPEVPERIHAMNSSIKLLLIVREPVTRVISDYTQIYGTNTKTHNGTKSPRLDELVLQSDGSVNVQYKAIRISLYSRYLQRWLDVFPPAQIHVIDGDALIRDPYPQLRDVERFLGLEPRLQRDNFYFNSTKGFYCWRKLDGDSRNETGLHCLNDSKGRRHPPVDRYIVSKLRQFYNPHNLRFYDMVGRDFGWPEK